ncbi:BRO family protein [Hoeflea phototrophica]|nr:BRO family protein [Hoeflea phototrophica]
MALHCPLTFTAIRVVTLDGNPWFVAADVCRALGLTTYGGATRHMRNLNQNEVGNAQLSTKGGKPNATVSESGLYKLIMRSDKPEAKAFQDWVTRDVLPAIRKDGGYVPIPPSPHFLQISARQAAPRHRARHVTVWAPNKTATEGH